MPQAETGDDLSARITQVDTSAFPTVTVYISVADASGEPAGINPDNIVLMENGNPVTPVEVRGMGEGEPLSTMLVIDVSGSMNMIGKLEAAKQAARAYIEQMRSGDQAGLIAFNTQVALVQPLTADRAELLGAIDGLRASSDTALYDAVAEAVAALENSEGRKAVLVLSDGMDNSSHVTLDESLGGMGPSGLSISTIGLGDPSKSSGEWAGIDEPALQDLAAQAGGSYAYVEDADALQAVYERLGRLLQSEFAITYISPAALRDGVSRSLSVRFGQMPASAEPQSSYNPGGLVPEVAQAAPWPVFLGALGGLAILLLAPGLVRRVLPARGESLPRRRKDSRVRLQEEKKPRVRLR
jgi:VWFA-related protein